MNIYEKITNTGIVPVIKLNNPEKDAQPLAKALIDGGIAATLRAEFKDNYEKD